MVIPILLKREFYFDLESNGFDIDCFESICSSSDFAQLLLIVKNTYTINIEMIGTDDVDNLFYDYDSFRMTTIDRKQPFFFDLAKIENKIVRSAVYAVFKEWVNKVAVVNGKTFHEWEMIFG
jgi:hypothetical protein